MQTVFKEIGKRESSQVTKLRETPKEATRLPGSVVLRRSLFLRAEVGHSSCLRNQGPPSASAQEGGRPVQSPRDASAFPAPRAPPGAGGGARSSSTGRGATGGRRDGGPSRPPAPRLRWTLHRGHRPAASGSRRARTRVGVGGRGATR